APGLVDTQRADHVRNLPAFVVERLGAEAELARHRGVHDAMQAAARLTGVVALRGRAAVFERYRGAEAVAELRRVGNAPQAAEGVGVTRRVLRRIAVLIRAVDVEVRPDTARGQTRELNEPAVEEDDVV